VEWAGPIGRERSFLVNLLDTSLEMTIFNPSYALGSFADLSNQTRLETVFVKYRLLGEVRWSIAYVIDDDNTLLEFNLAAPAKVYWEEDSYGYSTLVWEDVGATLKKDGTYELKVETVCDPVSGAPDDFNTYGTPSIIGVVDRSEPKLYGSPLPLRDLVIPGEEVVLMFSEPILCGKPYQFDLEVVVAGINGTFGK
jgi:hypothetical protein